jgi:hypothetical protein
MSLSLLLISVLAAPKAPTDSEMMVYLPKVDAVSQLLPFFNAAGSRAPLLRPESWRSQAHPLIEVDVTSKEALALVGIDSTTSLSNSRLGDTEVACVTISDVDKYRKAADAKLARLGEVFEKVENGVSVYATRDALGRVLAAYAVQGRDSCAISGHGRSVEKQLKLLAQTVQKPVTGPGVTFASKVPGVIQVLAPNGSQHGVVSLNAKDLVLTADAKAKGLPLAQLAGGGASPLGGFAANGMVVIRARVAKTQVPSLVEAAVKQFPGGAALLPIAREAAPLFTGNAALLLSHAKVTTGLRTREARFFALRSALIAEVSDPAAADALISKLDSKMLAFREGTISVTLEGSMLIVSNDPEVRAKAMTALKSAAGKQVHGVEFEVDPKLVAKALQQVPLLEAVQTPELAGLVAAGTELGPLLLASEKVSGWLDSAIGGVHTSQLVWRLEAAKFAPDAGVPPDAGTK